MTGADAALRDSSGEWRRGWSLVGLTAIGFTCAPSTVPVYTLGVFVAPLSAEFGWSRAAIQLAILFSTGFGAISAPVAGRLVRRFGVRWTVLPGLAGIALALAAASAMTGALWQLYVCYALMALLGAGAGGVAWTSLITAAFTRTRGLALGLALSGTGLSAILMPQIAAKASALHGWRGGYLALAGFALLVVLPLCVFGLPRRTSSRDRTDANTAGDLPGLMVREAVRTWRFWVLGLATAGTYVAVGGAIPNLVPALTDTGIPATRAVAALSALGGSIIAARIAVGALLDRFWGPAIAALVLLPGAAACVVFTLPASLAAYAIAAALLGAATGMELDILAFLAARYFGLNDFARIYARLYVFLAVPAGLAPLLFGALYDRTGSYHAPFLIAAGLLVLAAGALLTLGRYPPAYAPRSG